MFSSLSAKLNFFHNSDFFSSAFKHREHSLLFPAVFDSPSVYHPISVFPFIANSPPFFLSGNLSVKSCSLASFPITSQNCSQVVLFMPYPMAICLCWFYLRPNSCILPFLPISEYTKLVLIYS